MKLGIDIGGTKILALVVDDEGNIQGRGKKRVKDRDPESVLIRARKAARDALAASGAGMKDVRSVGLALPTGVDRGIARFAPQLGWRDVPIVGLAEIVFERPVAAGNDVNLGLLAECTLAGLGDDACALGFFLGSGMGGGVFVNGRVLEGRRGLAGEIGHIVVQQEGRTCGCGNRGCLEAYASKTAFLARIREAVFDQGRETMLSESISPEDVVIRSSVLKRAWDAGDRLVREVVEDGLRHFGAGVASMINALDPDLVVLGGGVIESFGAPMIQSVKDHARPHLFANESGAEVIRAAALGDDAVALGAARIA